MWRKCLFTGSLIFFLLPYPGLALEEDSVEAWFGLSSVPVLLPDMFQLQSSLVAPGGDLPSTFINKYLVQDKYWWLTTYRYGQETSTFLLNDDGKFTPSFQIGDRYLGQGSRNIIQSKPTGKNWGGGLNLRVSPKLRISAEYYRTTMEFTEKGTADFIVVTGIGHGKVPPDSFFAPWLKEEMVMIDLGRGYEEGTQIHRISFNSLALGVAYDIFNRSKFRVRASSGIETTVGRRQTTGRVGSFDYYPFGFPEIFNLEPGDFRRPLGSYKTFSQDTEFVIRPWVGFTGSTKIVGALRLQLVGRYFLPSATDKLSFNVSSSPDLLGNYEPAFPLSKTAVRIGLAYGF